MDHTSKQIEHILNQVVRPALARHQGGVEVTRVESGTVYIRLYGCCAACTSAQSTVEGLVEKALTSRMPEIRSVTVDAWDPSRYALAQKLLRHELSFQKTEKRDEVSCGS